MRAHVRNLRIRPGMFSFPGTVRDAEVQLRTYFACLCLTSLELAPACLSLVHSLVIFFACCLSLVPSCLRAGQRVDSGDAHPVRARALHRGGGGHRRRRVARRAGKRAHIRVLPTTLIENLVPSNVRLLAFFFPSPYHSGPY